MFLRPRPAILSLCIAFAIAAVTPTAAMAQESGELNALAAILGKVAIVVVLLESALSALFNWRVYRAVVNQRAMKTPVMLAFGLAICIAFAYDPFSQMLVQAGAQAEAAAGNWLTVLLSAFLLAGGSSGINTLFRNLGLRETVPDVPPRPALDESEAWIAVRVNGAVPERRYQIVLHEIPGDPGPLLAGTVAKRKLWDRVKEAFRSEAHRFPNYGGWSVKAGARHRIAVVDISGPSPITKTVHEGSFAPRAIVDFDVTM